MTITKFYHRRVFTMKKAQIIVDKYFLTGKTDKRIFGSFIEHLDVLKRLHIFEPIIVI